MKPSKKIIAGLAIFSVAANITACHYGPPGMEETTTSEPTSVEEETEETTSEEYPKFTVEENFEMDAYGPYIDPNVDDHGSEGEG